MLRYSFKDVSGIMCIYMRPLIVTILLLPLLAFAYTSVIANPVNDKIVLPISDPVVPQEFFGKLEGFPHTFQFRVDQTMTLAAYIGVPDMSTQKNDVSIILVKAERRSVSEIGRTLIKDQLWGSTYDSMLVESWRSGGSLEYTLVPGAYTFEVSSPDNRDMYRIVFGTEKIKRSYFENIGVLFEVKKLLGSSVFTIFLSPLIYVPLLLIFAAVLVGMYLYTRKKQKVHSM